jgi:hypothetical protein
MSEVRRVLKTAAHMRQTYTELLVELIHLVNVATPDQNLSASLRRTPETSHCDTSRCRVSMMQRSLNRSSASHKQKRKRGDQKSDDNYPEESVRPRSRSRSCDTIDLDESLHIAQRFSSPRPHLKIVPSAKEKSSSATLLGEDRFRSVTGTSSTSVGYHPQRISTEVKPSVAKVASDNNISRRPFDSNASDEKIIIGADTASPSESRIIGGRGTYRMALPARAVQLYCFRCVLEMHFIGALGDATLHGVIEDDEMRQWAAESVARGKRLVATLVTSAGVA